MDLEELDLKISEKPEYKGLLKECYNYAKRSNHPSTHTAALLVDEKVILKGANVLPPGVEAKQERFGGEEKHIYLNHAERDVIYKAARRGIPTEGLIMVMPWLPCIPCADAIITSGIKKLITHKQMIERTDKKWQGELKNSVEIMKEAGVDIVVYDGKVGAEGYMDGEHWEA